MRPVASPLRVGVVGAGAGGMLSARAAQASDRLELVSVADLLPDARARLRAEFPHVRLHADAAELVSAGDVDIVCVSTYATSHAEVADQALDAGVRGLLLEKPLADSWARARTLLDAVERRRVPVVVPHGLLVRRGPEELLRRLDGHAIGAIEVIEIECTGWDLMNAGIHWVNFALAALGDDPVQWVLCAADTSTRTYRDGLEVETEAVTYAGTRAGARLVMHTGDHVPLGRRGKDLVFRLLGSEGLAEFWGWEERFALRRFDGSVDEVVEVAPHPASAHQRYLERLAAMIEAGEADYRLPEMSLRALEVCEAAYLSHRHRCTVRLPLGEFVPPTPADWDPGAPYRGTGGRNGRTL